VTLLCGQLGYHLLESLDERIIGDRRFQPRIPGKLLVNLEALLTHGSPQESGGSMQDSQSPVIAELRAVMGPN
jgi:hypothetical protein